MAGQYPGLKMQACQCNLYAIYTGRNKNAGEMLNLSVMIDNCAWEKSRGLYCISLDLMKNPVYTAVSSWESLFRLAAGFQNWVKMKTYWEED